MKKAIFLIPVLALSACGGGGGSDTAISNSISGVAVDGYILGATVCIDSNDDGSCNGEAYQTITKDKGSFTLSLGSSSASSMSRKSLLITGGIDADTGQSITNSLTSIVDNSLTTQVISPLTSLVHAHVKNGTELEAAKQLVATSMQLSSVNAIFRDPVAHYEQDQDTYAKATALYQYATTATGGYTTIKDDTRLYAHFDGQDNDDDQDARKKYEQANSFGPVTEVTTPPTSQQITQPTQTSGRLLASNCFQCHGTNGSGGFERISGGEASEVNEFINQVSNAHIMNPHAQGYTSTQLADLVRYLNQL